MRDFPNRGCIFDADGSLLALTPAHAAAWSRAFAQYGVFDVWQADVQPHRGMGGAALVAALKPRRKQQVRSQVVVNQQRIACIALRSSGREDSSLARAMAVFDDPECLRSRLLRRPLLEARYA